MKYVCSICGYVYSVENPEPGYENVTDLLPEDFECPECGAGRDVFESEEEK